MLAARQAVGGDDTGALAQVALAGEAHGTVDPLGVPGLGRLHESGGARRVGVESLALADHDRARERADGLEDGDADPVEAGDVGEAGDAEARQMRAQTRYGLGRRHGAVGAEAPAL